MGLGPIELGLILLVVVMVFGAGKLSGLGSALGKSIKDFRQEVTGREPPGLREEPQ